MTIMFYFSLRHVCMLVFGLSIHCIRRMRTAILGKVYQKQHYLSAAYIIQSIVGFVCNAEVLYSIVQSFVSTTGFLSYQLTSQQLYDHLEV